MAESGLHFDGTMIAGGLGYSVDEVLAASALPTMATGVSRLDDIAVGIEPGAFWSIDGAAGIGVSSLALTIAIGAASTGSVILANGHIATRSLARRVCAQAPGVGASLTIASWLSLPIAGREALSTECERAGLIVLDTLDEMWRPPGFRFDPELALVETRLLREAARSAGTAVLATTRTLASPHGGDGLNPWMCDVLDDVSDVRISIYIDPQSGLRYARIRVRGDGIVCGRVPLPGRPLTGSSPPC